MAYVAAVVTPDKQFIFNNLRKDMVIGKADIQTAQKDMMVQHLQLLNEISAIIDKEKAVLR